MGSSFEANWAGRVFLWEGRALYLGLAGDTAPHSHHAVQVVVTLGIPLGLRVAGVDVSVVGAIAVSPNVEHQMVTTLEPLAILYLDPESDPARRLARTMGGRSHLCWPVATLVDLLPRLLQAAKTGTGETEAKHLLEETMGVLIPAASQPTLLDPRVCKALAMLKMEPASLEVLAREVQLSPSRLGHLFSEEVGLPFRPYRMWMRLQAALRSLASGVNLTTAAHIAGFSDSAHLSRSFRRMFGISPIELVRAGQVIHAPTSGSGSEA